MRKHHALGVVAVGAMIVGSATSSMAQQGQGEGQQQGQEQQGQQQQGQQSSPCPPGQVPAPTQAQGQQQEPGGPAVRGANQRADQLGNRLNTSIVGQQQQQQNQREAEAPRGPNGQPLPQGQQGQGQPQQGQAQPGQQQGIRCVPAQGTTHAQPQQQPSQGQQYPQGQMNQQGTTNQQRQGRPSMQPNGPGASVGQTAAQTTNGIDRTVGEVTAATNRPGPYRPFALEIDPLGLFLGGRFSLNAEWAPVPHHVIQVSPHFVHTTSNVAVSGSATASEAFTGFGTEVGYRYYTGTRGPNGVFVGPSLILGFYDAGLPAGNQPFTAIGVAGDVGVQEIFWNHLVAGGGVGLEYLQVSHDFGDLPTGPSTIATTGLKPRFLLEAGYAF